MRRILEYTAPAWVGWIGLAFCVASLATILFTDSSVWPVGSLGFLMTAASFDLTESKTSDGSERNRS